MTEEFVSLSESGVDPQTKQMNQMSEEGSERFNKLYKLRDLIGKEQSRQRMEANRKKRDDEFDAQKKAMLDKMREWELEDEGNS